MVVRWYDVRAHLEYGEGRRYLFDLWRSYADVLDGKPALGACQAKNPDTLFGWLVFFNPRLML